MRVITGRNLDNDRMGILVVGADGKTGGGSRTPALQAQRRFWRAGSRGDGGLPEARGHRAPKRLLRSFMR
ncbi:MULTISPECIES: hypothetical protein [Novosphingobium]|uniref:hypothetical protein n=1 Tax=unclassified Novosphingobium TaxID=2644732 RepID=UPI0006C8749A|nr:MULTISPECIES: hypothetical protein [unclassified Novosphingobium]KPH61827.1 hypothetical protein ADT71_16605 [Novosphingobium sp. ST904]MPS70487.1 hypothetical protein [Novosphingobium sp.]WRT96037.1 hypothetical protein U9J33_20870 [Novosphingobium sp. RL4]